MTKGWEIKRLGEICTNLDSKRIPITHSKRKKGDIPYYGASGIVDYVEGYIFNEDLLLVSEDGANLLMRTYPIAFSISGKTWVNNHAHVLRFDNTYSQRFVEYYLNSISLDEYVSGMAQPKLNQASLNNISVPFPLLSEQKRIVEILDETFAAIDKAKANVEKNLQNAKDLFESHLQDKLTQKREDFCYSKLVDITTKIGSGATPLGGEKAYKTTGISLIRSLNVYNSEFKRKELAFIDDKQASKLNNVVVELEDVLFNITGASIARCCLVPKEILPARVNQHVSIIRVKKDLVLPKFVQLSLISQENKAKLLKTGEAGATRQAITKAQLEEFKINYPKSKDQQKAIIDELDSVYKKAKKIEGIYQQKLNNLEELKKSILQKAFTGDLTAKLVDKILA